MPIPVLNSRSLVVSDDQDVLFCNSSSLIQLTVNPGIFTADQTIVIARSGLGEVEIVQGAGFNLKYPNAEYEPFIALRYTAVTLFFEDSTNALLTGTLRPTGSSPITVDPSTIILFNTMASLL